MGTLERTTGDVLTLVTAAACAIWVPLSARAQVVEAPAVVPQRSPVNLRPHEPIKVRRGFEHLTGHFGGWNGDSIVLQFSIGDPLVLPIGEVTEISARRRSADRAIAAGVFFGALTWVTLRVTSVLAGGLTQCEECDDRAEEWRTTGRVALVTTSIFLIGDYFRPPYRVVYRR